MNVSSLPNNENDSTNDNKHDVHSNSIDFGGNNNSNEEDAVVVDDPCWGTPTTCSLYHLLQHIRQNDRIVHNDTDYLVLNKPPDLRMDGDYPATVHKLLTYWFPPPSLLQQPTLESQPQATDKDHSKTTKKNGTISTEDDNNNNNDFNVQLLERISQLVQYPDLFDNELRPVHQLDYATSGVLLVAKSKPAAARARKWFEQRQIIKTYSAVLLGHVPTTTTTTTTSSSISSSELFQPTILHCTETEIDATMELIEYAFRKQRQKSKKQTWKGYLPVSSIFLQWKQYIIKTKKQQKQQQSQNDTDRPEKKPKRSPPTHKLNPEEWDQVWSHVSEMSTEQEAVVLELKWNQLDKNVPKEIIQQFEQATQTYNRIFKEKYWIHRHTPPPTLPTFFQLHPETPDPNLSKQESLETIYIYGDLAEDDDQFSMRIPEHLSSYCPYLPVAEGKDTTDRYDSDTPFDFKPSLTKCTILARSYIQRPPGEDDDGDALVPVTYVSFEPKTGRRHQLRIHAALMGTPILSDCTYSPPHISPKTYSPRLCLHSQSLRTKDGTFSVQTESPFVWDPTKDIIEIHML
jgi:23S rRNA-/tRNA-specific pseudouridylate synthase